MKNIRNSTLMIAALAALAGCAGPSKMVDNGSLPEAVRVPAGNKQVMYTVTTGGEITYECREKKDAAGSYEWAFAGPVANLTDLSGKVVGKYYAGPTWESTDGSKVTAKQVAVSPNGSDNIPLQLVKANPSVGEGAMKDISYIQRLNTRAGVAPKDPCGAGEKGQRKQVAYAADYVLYKAN